MKTYDRLITEIFGFSKKPKKTEEVPMPLKKFPREHEANDWMDKKAAHYAKHRPDSLHRLFDPTAGDYLPADVHTGSHWTREHQDHYRKIKDKYPEAVKKAKESYRKNQHISKSLVGDPQDYK